MDPKIYYVIGESMRKYAVNIKKILSQGSFMGVDENVLYVFRQNVFSFFIRKNMTMNMGFPLVCV